MLELRRRRISTSRTSTTTNLDEFLDGKLLRRQNPRRKTSPPERHSKDTVAFRDAIASRDALVFTWLAWLA